MQLADGKDVLVADDAPAFVAAVQRLRVDEPLWQRLSQHGMENVRQHFSAAAAAATLERVLG
jgi:glycosyltransferase involved in cell wall biosynthesis